MKNAPICYKKEETDEIIKFLNVYDIGGQCWNHGIIYLVTILV